MIEYLEKIKKTLTAIETEEREKLECVARQVADVIERDGLIYVFGCGHSHLPGLDAFYRAGGLGNVSPMLDTDLMLHNGAAKSSRMEKMSGIGKEIYRRYKIEKKDMLILFSASGKNEVPVEIARAARADGIFTVGVSGGAYVSHGARLHAAVDVSIDNKIPYGDACVALDQGTMGGLSTYASCYVLNTVLIEGAKIAEARGVKLPIYLSGNVEGGKEHNLWIEEAYLGRIKHL